MIFAHFGMQSVVISDDDSHFMNRYFNSLLEKYGVKHKVAIAYHPKISGQTKISNREIKIILEKVIGFSQKNLSLKLDDVLWAYRTAYKILIGMTHFKLVYKKPYHLPVELDHKIYWAIKAINFDIKKVREKRILDLHEFEESCHEVYENAKFYKERIKKWHDKHIILRDFHVGDWVFLFNSKFRLFPDKFKSKWSDLF
jgi:hypothetical protein